MSDFYVETNVDEFLARWNAKADDMPDVLEDVAEELGAEAVRLFKGTIRSWRHKPAFQAITEVRGGNIAVIAGTDDQIYGWVDRGTKPHVIRPRWAPRLVFDSVFTPKTRPGSLQSGAGGSKPPTVYAMEVHHPGTKPRLFSKKVQEQIRAKARPALSRRMKKWVRGR